MKRIGLLLVGLSLLAFGARAGEVITNDMGEDATGLRVAFSTPVLITAFGDILTSVDPQMISFEFVFSGGVVEPWSSHWMSWTPATASVMEYEWLTGSTDTPQGLPPEQRSARPVITGSLLNPDYFTHPAYVMQGVSNRDAVFAMPLDGIEELALYPIVDGVDPEDVTWSIDVSHPEGIGVIIESNTLYIWGSSASWVGYGEVSLEAAVDDAVSSVAIPVIVFREDKTLINAEGKKDYFVPWSPELDVNRILSVEEHMWIHAKEDLGLLDRTLRFSGWRAMQPLHDVSISGWLTEKTSGLSPARQYG